MGIKLLINIYGGHYTPNQKLPCFVLYLKIVNIFFKNDMYILKKIVQRTQKWH